ncbi:MAG: 30S ribosomal protein S13, partial [Candidatus Micrarchaeota archaeon]|nr:30S ribosomal protein S13 [Candidatus Micrarchaeota archaeon]
DLNIQSALMQIKGIGYNMSHALTIGISRKFGIPEDTTIGSLDEEKTQQVESLIKDPKKADVPNFILNRRNDRETGEDMHVAGTDLIVKTRQDIENDIKIQTYRGSRHRWGQKARGQRTRSTGRTGATVGVTKAKAEAAANPAPKGAPGAPSAAGAAPAKDGAAPAAAPAGEAKK